MTSFVSTLTATYPMDKSPTPAHALRNNVRRAALWFVDRQWRMTRKLGNAVLNVFTAHPAQTKETYFQHLWFTCKTSMRFLVLSLILFLHGVFPFLFTRTASKQIERIYLIMRSRIPEARREIIKAEYDI